MAPKRKEPEGDSPEEKTRHENRRQQNREAAQRCRDKKRVKGETVKKRVQQLRTEHTELNYQKLQLQEEKDRLQKLVDDHAKSCPKFKKDLDELRQNTNQASSTAVATISRPPVSPETSGDESDQKVPYNPIVNTEAVKNREIHEPSVTGLYPTFQMSGIGTSDTSMEQPFLSTIALEDTGLSIPTITSPGRTRTHDNGIKIEAFPSCMEATPTTVSQLGTETLNMFLPMVGTKNEPEPSSVSNMITLANTTLQEQNEIQTIYISNVLTAEAALTDSGKSTPQYLNRSHNIIPMSPASQYSDISADSPAPSIDHTPPSPPSETMAQLQRDQRMGSITPGDTSGKTANIPVMVLEQNQGEPGHSLPLSSLCDTMDFGIGILKDIADNK